MLTDTAWSKEDFMMRYGKLCIHPPMPGDLSYRDVASTVKTAAVVLRHTVCAIKNESRVTLAALVTLGRTVRRAGRLDTAPITGPCTDAVVASEWTSHGCRQMAKARA